MEKRVFGIRMTAVKGVCVAYSDNLVERRVKSRKQFPAIFSTLAVGEGLVKEGFVAKGIVATKIVAITAFMIALLSPYSASAELVTGLYDGKAVVETQSARERKKAAKQLLIQTLIRVSGSSDVATNNVVLRAVRNPNKYVQQFSYSSRVEEPLAIDENASLNPVLPAQPGQTTPVKPKTVYDLKLQFNSVAVEKLLRDAKLPLWPENRPTVLAWLVTKDSDGIPYLVNDSDQTGVYDALIEAGTDRGIPLITPLLDLQDQTEITEDDVWGLYHNLIRDASTRYQADSILVGRLDPVDHASWNVTWMFLTMDTSLFEGEAQDLAGAVKFGIDRVADNFAEQYAINPNEVVDGAILLQVDEVNDFAKYSAVADYLEGLVAIKKYSVMQVDGDTVYYRLDAQGNFQQLSEAIALDNLLAPIPLTMVADLPPSLRTVATRRLRYRWSKY